VTADDDRGCYDPVWPRFTVDVKKVDVKFDVQASKFRSYKPLNFLMFPYSI